MSGTEADSINKGYSSTSFSPGTNGVSTSEVQHGIGKQGFGEARDALFGLRDEGFGIWRDAVFGGMWYLEGCDLSGGATMSGLMPA